MKVKEITNAIERLAPRPLQEDYDNAGVQVGCLDSEVKGVLICLDVTEAVLDEAVAKGCNLVISHHPLIFRGLKRVTGDTYQERCVVKAVKNDIVIYSAHTNLDNADGGVNHKIASLIGLKDVVWLSEKPVTAGVSCGEGVVGILESEESAAAFLSRVKELFGVDCIMHNGTDGKTVRKVALCGGAGSFLLDNAIACGADCFITGEMSYHAYFGHDDEILIATLGHYQSEQFTKEIFRDLILREFPGTDVQISTVNTNPIQYLV